MACVKEGRLYYKVTFEYTEGMWRGKRVVPKNDYFRLGEETFYAYKDNQVLPILCNVLRKKYGIRTPYIVNIQIISRE